MKSCAKVARPQSAPGALVMLMWGGPPAGARLLCGASSVNSEEAVPGPSVFPSGEPGVSGDFWGSQEGCQGV